MIENDFDFLEPGGQRTNVERTIRQILGGMTDGPIDVESAVIKELLQNADDAGASEVAVLLDERTCPPSLTGLSGPLAAPALLVRNNKPFKKDGDPSLAEGEDDDFQAICNVALRHKESHATAAGRFGIGFNSVYFLTDTPIIFSRREVHVFDLLRHVPMTRDRESGFVFRLDHFPRSSQPLQASPQKLDQLNRFKNVLQFLFPPAILDSKSFLSFDAIASDRNHDYLQAVVRMPLRRTVEGTQSLQSYCFPDGAARRLALEKMANQAAKAVLFLKNVRQVTFGRLCESRQVEHLHEVTVTDDNQSAIGFQAFLENVEASSKKLEPGNRLSCSFDRRVKSTRLDSGERVDTEWKFRVTHVADFADPDLMQFRWILKKNDERAERAVPWGAIAIPLDSVSREFEGDAPAWRVFLPLIEEGPSGCVFCGAFFIGQSRRWPEFQLHESMQAQMKTEWNKRLVEKVLVPLLEESSLDFLKLIPDLVQNHPKLYLSLFPRGPGQEADDRSLADYFRRRFAVRSPILRLFDIWGRAIEWQIGDAASPPIEMTPEWLLKYRDRFASLSDDSRRFVTWALGKALGDRFPELSQSKIRRDVATDVFHSILRDSEPPDPVDLAKLIERLAKRRNLEPADLEGHWCCVRAADGALLKYADDELYVVKGEGDAGEIHGVLRQLQQYGFEFADTEWVKNDAGLPSLPAEQRRQFGNLVPEDEEGALQLLGRLRNSRHDSLNQPQIVTRIMDFLTGIPPKRLGRVDCPLRLAFLVRTASAQHERRRFGVVVVKPETDLPEDKAIWEALFRHTLAAADSQCATELHRLLRHFPDAREWLGDGQCEVGAPRAANALSVLDRVLSRFPDFLAVFREAIARLDREGHIKQATAALIREAVHNWDRLSERERNTLLALPIHRASNQEYVSLIGPEIGERNTLSQRCRIQSKGSDTDDAPIVPKEYLLLDSAEPSAKRLYRDILELDEHNRIAVLKDVLRQIGSDPDRNRGMLKYLADYLGPTLRRLCASSDRSEQRDARGIQELRERGKYVPCLDDKWRMRSECWDGWDLARHLQTQGWEEEESGRLIAMLFPDRSVAACDSDSRDLVRQVHGDLPQRIDPREIADRAISSESPALKLEHRIRLLNDNWPSSRPVTPARCIGEMTVPAITGNRVEICKACILPKTTRRLSETGRRKFFPQAVDLAALADDMVARVHVSPDVKTKLGNRLPEALAALGITPFNEEGTRTTVVHNFAAVWAGLHGDAERFAVLKDIDTLGLADELAGTAANLETVAVCRRQQRTDWVLAAGAISPTWLDTSPPLPSEMCPKLASTDDALRRVWDRWCGLRTFEKVANQVVQVAKGKRGPIEQARAARAVYGWLEKVRNGKSIDEEEFVAILCGLPWVFAARGANTDFRCPNEVFVGKGHALLSREFWVPYQDHGLRLPDFCRRRENLRELDFQTSLPPTPDIVDRLASCLEHSARSDRGDAISVYQAIRDLIDEHPELKAKWQDIAGGRAVFGLFREPECVVSGSQLFLGSKDFGEDFGDLLYCATAGSSGLQTDELRLYRELGVPAAPTTDQVLLALSNVDARSDSHRVAYRKLLAVLSKRQDELQDVPPETLRSVRVVTCDGRFRPLGECYWNEVLGLPGHLERDSKRDSCRWLIDTTDRETKRFVTSLIAQVPAAVQRLTPVAVPSPAKTGSELPAVTRLLDPWENWCKHVIERDRMLHSEAIEAGLNADTQLELCAVERIALQCQLPSGDIVRSAWDWPGPPVFSDGASRILIRADQLTVELESNADELEKLDAEIRKQVIQLLRAGRPTSDADMTRAEEFIRGRVERFPVYLGRLRKDAERHLLHQYNDQRVDREFAQLYDEFVRTREASTRHQTLEFQLLQIAENKFVNARREQIRQHGYDEFSVLAELVQNAEDAYLQREDLGMENPPEWSVRFWLERIAHGVSLCSQHYGRPFNHWRHEKGGRDNPDFRRDVEGLLRSSGSFKALTEAEAGGTSSRVIGRFGLGFKSVFLLTDSPSIYSGRSGECNFRIDHGCIPTHVTNRPAELPNGATRIDLPLCPEAAGLPKDAGQHALCLLPFLGRIREISIRDVDGREATAICRSQVLLERGGAVAERVTFVVRENGTERETDVIRVRHRDHVGQVAMYLASDQLPTAWRDAFSRTGPDGQTLPCDFYAVLPLKSDLGCGVAVSHRFEVQSGRTHLATSPKNMECAKQIAELLPGLVEAVRMDWDTNRPLAERLLRFWNLWRWDRGDAETAYFRRALADQLVELSRTQPIVPTLHDATAVSLGTQPLFHFTGVPPQVVNELIAAGFALDGDRGTIITGANVLPRGFVEPYRRLRQYAGMPSRNDWTEPSWDEIGSACRSTPWLARHPRILEAIAQTASEDAIDRIVPWLSDCVVRGKDGTGKEIEQRVFTLIVDGTGIPPSLHRFFVFVESSVYERSYKLLRRVASREPPPSAIRSIVNAPDLTQDEAVEVLRFLRDNKRWYKYDSLQREFQGAWFPGPHGRVTIAAASEAGILVPDVLSDAEFKAWLGLRPAPAPSISPPPPPPPPPPKEPGQILRDLYQWWKERGDSWTDEFERRTYGVGRVPQLSSEPNLKEREVRKQWLELFLLGACHTIGRTQPEQHRDFLDLCERSGWLDTFAARDTSAEEWIGVLETYLDRPTPDIPYYRWAMLFVPIFQLSKWLDEYVPWFVSTNKPEPASGRRQILRPAFDPSSSGGGRDAPSLSRTLGIGACFVLRELCRLGVVQTQWPHRYCFVPSRRVGQRLNDLAGRTVFQADSERVQQSESIYKFLQQHLSDKATFDGGFDLPLIAVCEKPELRADLKWPEGSDAI